MAGGWATVKVLEGVLGQRHLAKIYFLVLFWHLFHKFSFVGKFS